MVFSYFFACGRKDTNLGWPKAYGSYGSGSTTLIPRFQIKTYINKKDKTKTFRINISSNNKNKPHIVKDTCSNCTAGKRKTKQTKQPIFVVNNLA
jgi:hypothetical protein